MSSHTPVDVTSQEKERAVSAPVRIVEGGGWIRKDAPVKLKMICSSLLTLACIPLSILAVCHLKGNSDEQFSAIDVLAWSSIAAQVILLGAAFGFWLLEIPTKVSYKKRNPEYSIRNLH